MNEHTATSTQGLPDGGPPAEEGEGDRAGYGPECVLRLVTGVTVRTEPYSANEGGVSYVRVCAPDGREIAYWDYSEWAEDPQGVMGAIFGAALMRHGDGTSEPGTAMDSSDDHQLVWRNGSDEDPDVRYANSVHRIAPRATCAVYTLSIRTRARTEDLWSLELLQIMEGDPFDLIIDRADLGEYPDEDTAKAHAQRWEEYGSDTPPK